MELDTLKEVLEKGKKKNRLRIKTCFAVHSYSCSIFPSPAIKMVMLFLSSLTTVETV